ncbi:helix-turn-helix domain-containing protein [Achromobacter xylosoxidans]
MHPEDIKAALRKAGVTQAALADELDIARSSVAQAISGSIRSARIQARIAEIIGKPVKEIWPGQIVLRRSRDQIEAQRRAVA